ncbi:MULTISPECIES: DUF481 domain-containing protein [Niastella]|uniref:DUF481 domain-containing protein n=1 Tax=Niastella soli TaxID=2821487 RepID=A0ABS3YX41_9BACT|nr:DUF481 domain-containing protein [Niastella soli]MBO9201716.1 DUF481 domain-containing protein [Niastella soli]
MRYVLLLLLTLAALQITAQSPRDTIYFKNGTMVIGKIKKIKLGVITFDPDDANDITVQLKKLRTMAARYRPYRIESTSHIVYFGKITASDRNGYANFMSEIDTTTHFIENISVLYPARNSFFQRFSGSATAGLDFTRSSGLGRINYDGKINYNAKKVELTLSASGIYTLTDSTFSRDREDVNIKYNYYFNTTWFGTLLLKYQRNLELGLTRRFQEGIGGGNKFLTNKNIYAWTRIGMVANQEKNTENTNTGTLFEIFGQLEFNFFKFTKPEISFSVVEAFYYSLSQKDRVRNDASTTFSYKIIKDLNLTLSFYSNFDSEPPSEESRKFDFGTVLGISYIF